MTNNAPATPRVRHDYVRTLEVGLQVAIRLRVGATHASASLTAPCLKSSLIAVFPPADLHVQPSLTSTALPTLWLGSLSIDVTQDEAVDIQAFIDQAHADARGGA